LTPQHISLFFYSRHSSHHADANLVPASATVFPIISSSRPPAPFFGHYGCFVEDFIGLAQTSRNRHCVYTAIFDSIDSLFRPPAPTNSAHRKDAISFQKLLQGDANWSTSKTILGRIVGSIAKPLTFLPPHRLSKLSIPLESVVHHRKRMALRKWQQLIGELCIVLLPPALPGSRSLFSLFHGQYAPLAGLSTSRTTPFSPISTLFYHSPLPGHCTS